MKKLFFFLLLVTGVTSCTYRTAEYSPEEQLQETTVEILNNIDNTKQLSIVKDRIYIVENSLVVASAQIDNNNQAGLYSSLLHLLIILLITIMLLILLESTDA